MREKPTEDEMATFYQGLRHGDSVRTICKILKISNSQYNLWMTIGKRAEQKKRWNDPLTKEDKACLKFKNLVRSAKRRRRR